MRDRIRADYERLGLWRVLALIVVDGIIVGLTVMVTLDWLGLVTRPYYGAWDTPIRLAVYFVAGVTAWLVTAGRWHRKIPRSCS